MNIIKRLKAWYGTRKARRLAVPAIAVELGRLNDQLDELVAVAKKYAWDEKRAAAAMHKENRQDMSALGERIAEEMHRNFNLEKIANLVLDPIFTKLGERFSKEFNAVICSHRDEICNAIRGFKPPTKGWKKK